MDGPLGAFGPGVGLQQIALWRVALVVVEAGARGCWRVLSLTRYSWEFCFSPSAVLKSSHSFVLDTRS